MGVAAIIKEAIVWDGRFLGQYFDNFEYVNLKGDIDLWKYCVQSGFSSKTRCLE